MNTTIAPPTVNLHSLIPCNYKCGFCYAGFVSANRSHVPQSELHEIIRQLSAMPRPAGMGARKLTFAGGEPLLSPTAFEDIAFARAQGLVTSLVTNGSLLTEEKLHQLARILDWLTISIDSLDAKTNLRIGRAALGATLSADDYLARIHRAKALGIEGSRRISSLWVRAIAPCAGTWPPPAPAKVWRCGWRKSSSAPITRR